MTSQTMREALLFRWPRYRPTSVLTLEGPVEYCIAAEISNYIDLANTFLYVKASVMQANGMALKENVEIAPERNFFAYIVISV